MFSSLSNYIFNVLSYIKGVSDQATSFKDTLYTNLSHMCVNYLFMTWNHTLTTHKAIRTTALMHCCCSTGITSAVWACILHNAFPFSYMCLNYQDHQYTPYFFDHILASNISLPWLFPQPVPHLKLLIPRGYIRGNEVYIMPSKAYNLKGHWYSNM